MEDVKKKFEAKHEVTTGLASLRIHEAFDKGMESAKDIVDKRFLYDLAYLYHQYGDKVGFFL